MEITGPDLPNLAFIDLPGVIQTTESVGAFLGVWVVVVGLTFGRRTSIILLIWLRGWSRSMCRKRIV